MARVGHGIESESDKLYTAFKIEQEKTDTTKVEDAWNEYKNHALDLTNGKEGLLNTKGSDAVNGKLLDRSTTSLTDARTKIADGLTDEQRQRFEQRANITDLQTKTHILTHLATEQRAYAQTVFQGSEAAAKAQVSAMPTSAAVFDGARDTLMRQADAYLAQSGVTDKGMVDLLKAKLTDSLWVSRINAVLYSQPILADAMFRANQDQIKDPELRLVMQHKTREASISVQASNEAQRTIDETRAEMPSPTTTNRAPVVGIEVGAAGGTGPRSARNNNPGNIEKSNVRWQGEVPGGDARFVTFATYEDGVRAMQQNLISYQERRGLNTVEGIISRWAPAKENGEASTRNYINTVAKAVGVKPGDQIDLHDPATMQKMTAAMTAFEGGGTGSMQRVSNQPQEVLAANTSGMPNSRDIAAQLPMMEGKVVQRANELYGPDQGNPDRAAFIKRMTSELHSKVGAEVQQLNAIQRQAQGTIIDAITGLSGPAASAGGMVQTGGQPARAMITSFSQIQSDPQLFRAWQMMDPQAKLAAERLMEHNMRANDQGDVVLYRTLFNRIHLEPGDPNKIDFYRQIVDPSVANRLSMPQIQQLRQEIDRSETPGGRSPNQLRKAADASVSLFFKTNAMFTAQPERQIAATMRWNEAAGQKIDEYVKAGKDVRSLFMLDSKDSLVSPAYLQTYIDSTPAQGLANQAARAGQPAAAQAPVMVKTIEERDALPPGTIYIGPDGKTRARPGQAAPQNSAPAQGSPQSSPNMHEIIPPATMTETGKIVQPAAAEEEEITLPPLLDKKTAVEIADEKRAAAEASRAKVAAGVRAAGKAVGQTAVAGVVAGVEAVGAGVRKAVEAVTPPSDAEKQVALFRGLLKTGYRAQNQDTIEEAIASGLLTPPERRAADRMLAAISGRRK